VELYRSLPRLLACVLCAAAAHVTVDAEAPGRNITMAWGTKRPGGDAFLQGRSEAKAEATTGWRS
jgi:hypothetical protein